MRKTLRCLLCLLICIAMFAAMAPCMTAAATEEQVGESGNISRIYGDDRYETAYAVANKLKDILDVEAFDTIVVAYGRGFADALAGSYLATELDAPILLTEDSEDSNVQAYILENLTSGGKVYILGGTAVVSQAFEDGLKKAGINVERLYGDSRYLTNLAILEEAGLNGKEILVCTGTSFADSLSASAANRPILLVNNDTGKLTEEQKTYLETLEGCTFYIVGGTSAVSEELENALSVYGKVERVYGNSREETSVKVAETFCGSADTVALAYSRNFPDGLCGGPLAYNLGAPLLLVNAGQEAYAADYVENNDVNKGVILGGTAAVPNHVATLVFGNVSYATTITLHASKTELSIDANEAVYFYAELNGVADSVELVDASTGSTVAKLVDDGMYSVSGDDLLNDNIYSGTLMLDTSAESQFTYYAVAHCEDALVSDPVQINVISGFTDDELADMETVDLTIQEDLFSADGFKDMTLDERAQLADAILDSLCDQGLTIPESVLYDEENSTYTFIYESGAPGAIILDDWNEEQNGTGTPTREERIEAYNASRTLGAAENTTNVSTQAVSDCDAIILWSFNQAWDSASYREPFYSETEQEWEEMGLNTTVVWNTTVQDYKNLDDYEIIIFSGHGTYHTYKAGSSSVTVSSLLLSEKSTSAKDTDYASDLKQFRIGKISVEGGTMYAILPNFFSEYYSSGDLDGSFVFAENCEFNGKDGKVNKTIANELINASAEAVIGFHNSVMADYSRELMKEYVDELLEGKTVIEAFNNAKSVYGDDDYFSGREKYGPTAYPLLTGDEKATLVHTGIENGDFELSSTALGWEQIGDTRILTQLGKLVAPSNQRMAILTTGIGSAEEDYLTGTEGSVLSQVFKIPEGTSTLTFCYDVVSEEPTEYIGTSFNDTFIVRLTVGSETVTMATEDINTSTWYAIDGIDFEGGDQTTYHTTWKTVKFDISEYAGQIAALQFIVYDVGDSIYDTAALIDNVYLS